MQQEKRGLRFYAASRVAIFTDQGSHINVFQRVFQVVYTHIFPNVNFKIPFGLFNQTAFFSHGLCNVSPSPTPSAPTICGYHRNTRHCLK